jgi:hypothetical protein
MTLADARNLALCYFIIVAIPAVLLPGIILFLLSKGISILKRRMLPYVHLTQFYSWRVAFYTDRASRTIVTPILFVGGGAERVRYYASQINNWIRQKEA